MSKKSDQETSWTAQVKHIFVNSEDERERIIMFLNKELELDKLNYQMMLNTVDIETLTKAKITALGKLGKQYDKASKALIKKYKSVKVNTTMVEEKEWIIKQ